MTYARRSARVILVDARDRVLLMSMLWDSRDPGRGSAWFTPGGGVGDGEASAVAAARELREETGLDVTPERLGDAVAFAHGHADLAWVSGQVRDDFFFHRVAAHEVDTAGLEEFERTHFLRTRWWTLAELKTTGEPVIPYGLAGLLADLLAGRLPTAPVELPWHH